ncbi:MAG: hypothetical protein JNJ61_14505 [Anaerolineae bacterium]|nr:hypothetical protein [Anaerolineae bacterium]
MAEFRFDPDRVAYVEAAGWRAYYDRNWLKLFYLVASLSREQFHIPFPLSLLAAYYIAKASRVWVPVEHDLNAVAVELAKFYVLARRYSSLKFDPQRAAYLEATYWTVHRELVGQPDKSHFVQVLSELHQELFGVSGSVARESAQWRVQANNTVDGITSGTSLDPEGDWHKLEDELRRGYRLIQAALAAQHAPAPA